VKKKEEFFMKRSTVVMAGLFLFIFVVAISGWAQETRGEVKTEQKTARKAVLDEITVTDTPYVNPVTPVDTRYGTQYNIITEEQIKQQNSYDFQSTLRDVPGVMSQSKNLIGSQTSHSLYIRGRGSSHPSSDFTVLFDGVPRYGALFGQMLGDGIAVSTIGSIEVYKSPQPSQFGSGYALINIVPKYQAKEGSEAVIKSSGGSSGTLDENLSAGVKKGPFDIYASQSLTRTDGDRNNSGENQQGYYTNIGYKISKEWNLRFLVNYVKGKTEAPMPDAAANYAVNGINWPAAERFKTETLLGTLTLNHEYERAGGYIKAYWNNTDFELLQEFTNKGVEYAGGTGGLWSRQEIAMNGVRAREKFNFWKGGEIIVGADLDFTTLKNIQKTYSGTGAAGINDGKPRRVWDFPDTRLFSPYAAVSHLFGRNDGFHLTPSAGARYYSHNEFENKSSTQGGLVIGYKNTDLNLNYARGVNYPSPVVLMNMVKTNARVDNPRNIKPEVVDHYELGITHKWLNIASLGATIFYDKGKDRFLAYMGGTVPLRFNDPIGSYDIRGLEITGTTTPLKNLELFVGATWLAVEAKGADNIESNHMPYTPGFQFQAGAKWKFLDNFQVFADMQHLRNLYQGQSNGAARGGTFNMTKLTGKDKLDDITLVNARISYQFDYKPFMLKDSEVFVAINNIFNQDYEYARGYPMPGTTYFGGFTVKFN
jgi:iron complex outermembrane receptor protein